MIDAETARLEHAGRSAIAWAPESYDGQIHFGYVLRAAAPAIGILAVAVTLLVAIL